MIDFSMSAQEKVICTIVMGACVAMVVLSLLSLPFAAVILVTIVCSMVFTVSLLRLLLGICS